MSTHDDDLDLEDMPDARDVERSEKPRRRRRRLIALGIVAALLLGGCAIVGGYLFNLQHSFYSKSVQVALPSSSQLEGKGENYLLLGSDKRDPDSEEAKTVKGQRSDAIMLVHVSADKKKVYVISFPRDLYIDIPGHGTDRINSALAYGGVPLAVTTVENYTGAKIDHVALIDFDGVKGLVDALGGVDVHVDQSFVGDGVQFTQGIQHMDGATALTFVRQRKQLADGDFARNRHQQALLQALADKIISSDTLSDPGKIQKLVDVASPYLTVDDGLTPSAMISTAYSMRQLRSSDINDLSVPHGGPTTTSAGASVIEPDESGMQELRTALHDDTMDEYYAQHAR